jgi:heme/copper-type cytochrome/quinol oxidase subunit 4
MDHGHTAHSGESHGSFGSYTAGFILSVLLTAAAFGIIMTGSLTGHSALLAIAGLAFVQIIVHLVGATVEHHGVRLYGADRRHSDRRLVVDHA